MAKLDGPASLTMMELGVEALKSAPFPMTAHELWDFAKENGIPYQTTAKRPWDSLGSLLYMDTKGQVQRVGRSPTRFWLRSKELPKGSSIPGPSEYAPPEEPKERDFKEKDLHKLLAWFARTQLNEVRVKTIPHEVSTKKSYGEWAHPDVIGARFPRSVVNEQITIDFASAIRAPLLRMFSFELKREVNNSNLRESFFQAVSNSSWANEGYLVAADWLDDEDFSEELTRLSQSFGIGAIHLDLDDLTKSKVLRPARLREEIDWTTLDKLARMNSVVASFLRTVKTDLVQNHPLDAEYDQLPPDPDAYAKDLAKR